MDPTSRFNRATKLALQDLKTWMPEDPYPKALCKTYMRLKRSDRQEPLRRFASFWAAHPSWTQDLADRKWPSSLPKDVDDDHATVVLLTFGARVPETCRERIWDHLDTLLDAVRRYEEPSRAWLDAAAVDVVHDSSASNLDTPGEGLPNLSDVILKTTELMPQVFQQLGMNVSPEEVQKAASHLQSSHMMGMLTRMMSSPMMANMMRDVEGGSGGDIDPRH